MESVEDHFEVAHKNNLHTSSIYEFSISSTEEMIFDKLFIIGKLQVMVNAVYDPSTGKLNLSAVQLGTSDSTNQFRLYSENDMKYSFICCVNIGNWEEASDEFLCSLDISKYNSDTLSLVLELIKNDQLSYLIKYDSFECSFCHKLLRPPIHICSTKLHLRGMCCSKYNRCPFCCSMFETIPFFDTFLQYLNHSCEHDKCNVVLPYNLIKLHENNCKLCIFKCLFNDCDSQDYYSVIRKHLREEHEKSLFLCTLGQIACNEEKCFDNFGNLFFVSIESDHSFIHYSFQLIGPSGEEHLYGGKLELADNSRSEVSTFVFECGQRGRIQWKLILSALKRIEDISMYFEIFLKK